MPICRQDARDKARKNRPQEASGKQTTPTSPPTAAVLLTNCDGGSDDGPQVADGLAMLTLRLRELDLSSFRTCTAAAVIRASTSSGVICMAGLRSIETSRFAISPSVLL
eukprot:TRINITY_DN38544_c0_g1_i2.p2 TRINITY_DN38544_c0_g1~~TRINITY_DN38544_c0_g1_i2.p2  ORF type:complete len:109 (+),score=16.30 TRINITY_DN38544_c0_g1_i2:64-390(+)